MYYSHFGLAQPPFRITPDTEFFYSGGNRGPILEALVYAIGQGEGIIKVTGEVGSGKTMLCTMLQTRLPPQVETVYLANPSVSPEEILHAVAFELQLGLAPGAGRLETMHALQRHLTERHAEGCQVVMFVEESQSMPLATLEEIRLLSNLETQHHKLLQIVLFGQPELEDNLRQPQIRQLRERITHSFRLSPLPSEEVRDYLNFRLRAAGYRGPDLFPPPVVAAIVKASGGLSRRINLIADKTLLAAFSENTHTVRLKHVKAAVRDSEFNRSGSAPGVLPRIGLALCLLAVGMGVGVGLYALWQSRAAPPGRPAVRTAAAAPAMTPVPPLTEQAAASPAPSETAAAPAPALTNSPPPSAASTHSVAAAATAASPATPSPPEHKIIKKEQVETSSPVPASDADLLQNRLAATPDWLSQQAPGTYTLQLLGTGDSDQLKHHLNVIGKSIEINDVFVYRTLAKQRPWLTVVYRAYPDRAAAVKALTTLPAEMRAYHPYLRTIQGIRAETAGAAGKTDKSNRSGNTAS